MSDSLFIDSPRQKKETGTLFFPPPLLPLSMFLLIDIMLFWNNNIIYIVYTVSSLLRCIQKRKKILEIKQTVLDISSMFPYLMVNHY